MRNGLLLLAACLVGPSALASGGGEDLDLRLRCVGSGSQEKPDIASIEATNENGQTRSATITGTTAVGFSDEVQIEISGDTGRIRVPQAMLPPIRGGDNGWFKLRKIEASPDEITAVATINLFNKVKIRLDRGTGHLSFSVLKGYFQGACRAFDPGSERRAF